MLISAEAINLNDTSPPDQLVSEDVYLNITSTLLYTHLSTEIYNILESYDSYGITCIRNSTLKGFIDKLYKGHNLVISNQPKLTQEIFLLYQICKAFYSYNHKYLNLSHTDFRAKILYPNLVYIMIRYFPKAHHFFRNTLGSVYNEYKKQNYGIIKRHAEAYYLDHEIIKTDVLYEFLGNALKQFDPLTLRNTTHFYKSIFRNIFNYYFRKKHGYQTSYSSFWEIDSYLAKKSNIPTRLTIYRDVLYKLQIEKYCFKSPTLQQLSYNFQIFRNVIATNEFQNLFFSLKKDIFMLDNNQYKLLKIYNMIDEDELITEIKKLPTVYNLFRCVHVINSKSRPYNEMIIKPNMIKNAVLEELIHPFKNLISDDHIYSILDKISDNFVNNILTGEYINLLTFSSVKINQLSFITQIRKLVQLCLKGILK